MTGRKKASSMLRSATRDVTQYQRMSLLINLCMREVILVVSPSINRVAQKGYKFQRAFNPASRPCLSLVAHGFTFDHVCPASISGNTPGSLIIMCWLFIYIGEKNLINM